MQRAPLGRHSPAEPVRPGVARRGGSAGRGMAALLGGVVWLATLWSAPAPRRVGPPPPDLAARSVEFVDRLGRRMRGWLAPGNGTGGVVLVHGVRETRRAMLDRARFLHRAGYAVLLFDLPAHGESDGDRVTFGDGEASAVRAAVDLLAESLPGPTDRGARLLARRCGLPARRTNRCRWMRWCSKRSTRTSTRRSRTACGCTPVPRAPWLTPLFIWQLGAALGDRCARAAPGRRICRRSARRCC